MALEPLANPHVLQTQQIPNLSQKLPPLNLVPRRRSKETETPSEPPPPTPPLPPPPDPATVIFQEPVKRIITVHDHELFLASDTYKLILAFVFGISDSIAGRPISAAVGQNGAEGPGSEDHSLAIQIILQILSEAQDLLLEYPAEDTGSRFGNPIFRDYMRAIQAKLKGWHSLLFDSVASADHTTQDLPSLAIAETYTYLLHAFGSASRIDYGSGHELNFLMWLLCLNRLAYLPPSSFPTLGLIVIPRYLQLMRAVQAAYYLEPAGSHGVWGLDDYQFIPFLLGASQLVGHKFITPRSIHSAVTLDEFGKDYLYLEMVQHINAVKNVEGLRWHSPLLDDISGAKSWVKVEGGLKKMFVKEVLGKRAVMQHFLFGGMLPAADGMTAADVVEREDGHEHGYGCVHPHDHDHDASWDDPCGIRVPGAVGAAEEARKMGKSSGLRRLPFD